jgi:hypothetical protein
MSKFEDNGGYFIDGVPYMDCKYTGIPVKNVSTDCKEVISDRALQSRMYKMFPEDFEKDTKPTYKPTGNILYILDCNALSLMTSLQSVLTFLTGMPVYLQSIYGTPSIKYPPLSSNLLI